MYSSLLINNPRCKVEMFHPSTKILYDNWFTFVTMLKFLHANLQKPTRKRCLVHHCVSFNPFFLTCGSVPAIYMSNEYLHEAIKRLFLAISEIF